MPTKGMPFVFAPEQEWHHPNKRRKLLLPSIMARRDEYTEQGIEPKCHDTSYDVQLQASEVNHEEMDTQIRTSDREELIQCIKRGQRPTWVPKPGLEALYAEENTEYERKHIHETQAGIVLTGSENPFQLDAHSHPNDSRPLRHTNASIELPTFHKGEFREAGRGLPEPPARRRISSLDTGSTQTTNPLALSPQAFSPPTYLTRANTETIPVPALTGGFPQRSRAPSLGSSLSSSFVMRVPTSPLVHSINNSSLDFSPEGTLANQLSSLDRTQRRRTMPPNMLSSLQVSHQSRAGQSISPSPGAVASVDAPGSRFSHQSRRSLSSFTYQGSSGSPPLPHPAPRRLSQAGDVSPRQKTSMVGSFEESILRGRMSTAPSKPLEFVAQIGVLGRGDCPASLKCPAHATVSFPAVYYNYSSDQGSRRVSGDSPSPYVGSIDLEHNLKPIQLHANKKRKPETNDPDALVAEVTGPESTKIGKALARDAQSQHRPSITIGGAYRVPRDGQLQIIIKNPNKTAVKLFLVPYSLEGMQAGNKTFVRQKSWSSGPIIENALSGNPSGVHIQDPLSEKRILQYLIHLKFCCPTKGKFYLYDDIRVVFANRVPDGKEKLHTEIQAPEPRFSSYMAGSQNKKRASLTATHASAVSITTAIDFVDGSCREIPDTPETDACTVPFLSSPIPFHLASRLEPHNKATGSTNQDDKTSPYITEGSTGKASAVLRPQSPITGFDLPSTSARASPVSWSSSKSSPGARSFSPVPPEAGGGLLSRKLRELNRNSSQNANSSAN